MMTERPLQQAMHARPTQSSRDQGCTAAPQEPSAASVDVAHDIRAQASNRERLLMAEMLVRSLQHDLISEEVFVRHADQLDAGGEPTPRAVAAAPSSPSEPKLGRPLLGDPWLS